MNRKVYSYMRFSTPEQKDGHSLARQTDYARQYAEKHNLSLDDTLSMRDEGLSAYHQKHIQKGALGVFFRAIEEGMVQPGSILIVENLDRLSRANITEALPRFMDIINSNITLVTANNGREFSKQSIDSSPFTLFESLIEMVRANQESQYKSDRVKDAIVAQIKHWQQHGSGKIIRNGRDPLWVQPNEDKTGFELIPERADVVRLIIGKYLNGWGYIKIIEYLKNNYQSFSGRTWYMSYLSHMLKSRCLIGERSFTVDNNRFIISDYYPAIISEDRFNELQRSIKTRASTRAQQRIPSIITGNQISFCGHCGGRLVAQNHKPRPSKKNPKGNTRGLRRICCISRNSSNECPQTAYNSGSISNTVSAVPIEHALLSYCSDHMELSAILNDDDYTSLAIKAKISELQHQSSESETLIANGNDAMTRLLVQGDDVSAINSLVKQHQSKLDDLKSRIKQLEEDLRFQKIHKSSDLIAQWKQVKLDVLDMDEETRLLVRQIVKKTFKRMDIYFHSFGKSDTGMLLRLPIDDQNIVMILTFNNDKTRILVIDRKSGDWVTHRDVQFNESSIRSGLADNQVRLS